MKRISSFILSGLALVAMSVTVASCSDNAKFIGTWTEAAPTTVASANPDAPALTSQITLDFTEGTTKDGGGVTLKCSLEGVRNIAVDTVMVDVQVKGTGTVSGSWAYDVDDSDDLLLTFDMSTINVDITSEPALAPEAIEILKREVNQVFTSTLSHYTTIEDVKVSDDGKTLTFETDNPDRKHNYSRVEI